MENWESTGKMAPVARTAFQPCFPAGAVHVELKMPDGHASFFTANAFSGRSIAARSKFIPQFSSAAQPQSKEGRELNREGREEFQIHLLATKTQNYSTPKKVFRAPIGALRG